MESLFFHQFISANYPLSPENWIAEAKKKKHLHKYKSYFIVLLIFVFFFHPLFQTSCTLTLFNMTDENIIISARLPHDSKINPMDSLRKEKVNFSSYLIWFMCCYFMCVFPFTIFFFFYFVRIKNVVLLRRRRIKKKFLSFYFPFTTLLFIWYLNL